MDPGRSRAAERILVALLVGAGGCGAGRDGDATTVNADVPVGDAVDGGSGATVDGGFVVAAHTPFPVLTRHGGQTIGSIRLVTLSFAGYAYEATVRRYADFIVDSAWIRIAGADYGVGPGTHTDHLVLDGSAPALWTNQEVIARIATEIRAHRLPSPDRQTLYLLFLPPGSTVDESRGDEHGLTCVDNWAYHDYGSADGLGFAYGVVGDCTGSVDDVTSAASHEIMETATDPKGWRGYVVDAASSDPWSTANDQEVGDLCQWEPWIRDGEFAVQRTWSNSAAAAGGAPCVPLVDGEIYYGVTASPSEIPKIAAGTSAVFTITGWSTAPRAPFGVALALGFRADFDAAPFLDGHSLDNGATARLTLSVPAGTHKGRISSVLISVDGRRYWPVAVEAR